MVTAHSMYFTSDNNALSQPTGLTARLFGKVSFNKFYSRFNHFRNFRPAGEGRRCASKRGWVIPN